MKSDTESRVVAVYAGTFDPFTLGHLDVVKRAASVFDKVIVAVAASTGKNTALPLEIRKQIAELSVSNIENVKVNVFRGLLTDYVSDLAAVIVRGIRSVKDFEYERALEAIYKSQAKSEVVYLNCDPKLSHVSSNVVRELSGLGGDISGYVAEDAKELIENYLKRER